MKRLALVGAMILGTVVRTPAAPTADSEAVYHATLADLHDGRFDAAEARLAPLEESPGKAFFHAFVDYWRLLYHEDDPTLRGRFDGRLDTAIALASERLDADPSDLDARLWAGTSRLLLAQLRALEKKPFAAAAEAKRAKRLLEAAIGPGPAGADAAFVLGTYDYMADRLPAFVKGLRALLFLPAGDRDRGLAELDRAARESRYFALESRILLATIRANKHERDYTGATDEARRALASAPGVIAAEHTASKIDLDLARPAEAARRLDAALARALRFGDVDPSVTAALEILRARADFALFRPDLARARAQRLAARVPAPPDDVLKDARDLAGECDAILAGHGWALLATTLSERGGSPGDGDPAPIVALASRGSDPIVMLFAGRALLGAHDGRGASRWLAAAEASGLLPRPWIGPCRLMAGQAADLAGDRALAVAAYKRAVDAPSFAGKDAAWMHQRVPYRAGS